MRLRVSLCNRGFVGGFLVADYILKRVHKYVYSQKRILYGWCKAKSNIVQYF